MKRITFLLALLAISFFSFAQTVENIQVEQDGDKLNIHYRIGGSTSEQMYFVTLTCKIDGGPVFEPKSVIGDVGSNIRGGKSFNTIVWNVFEDVEEIGNVEFFVKVDLVKDETQQPAVSRPADSPNYTAGPAAKSNMPSSGLKERHFFLAYSGTIGRPYGAKIGYVRNWGVYGALRIGADYYYYYPWEEYDVGVEMVAGIAKKVAQRNNFRTYMYGGIGYGGMSYGYYDVTNSFNDYTLNDYYATFDIGAMGVIGRFYFDLGLTLNSYYLGDLIFGIGLVF